MCSPMNNYGLRINFRRKEAAKQQRGFLSFQVLSLKVRIRANKEDPILSHYFKEKGGSPLNVINGCGFHCPKVDDHKQTYPSGEVYGRYT